MLNICEYLSTKVKIIQDSLAENDINKLTDSFNDFKKIKFTDKNPEEILDKLKQCLQKVDSNVEFETNRTKENDIYSTNRSGSRGELVYPKYAYNTTITFLNKKHIIDWSQGGGSVHMKLDDIEDAISGSSEWYSFVYDIKYDKIFELFKTDMET